MLLVIHNCVAGRHSHLEESGRARRQLDALEAHQAFPAARVPQDGVACVALHHLGRGEAAAVAHVKLSARDEWDSSSAEAT